MSKLAVKGSTLKNDPYPMLVVGAAPTFIVDTLTDWQNQLIIEDSVLSSKKGTVEKMKSFFADLILQMQDKGISLHPSQFFRLKNAFNKL